MECDCGARKGCIWKTDYMTRAFSFDTAIDNLQMQPCKEEQEEEKQRKGKN